jgi:hypothetical protein
VEEAQVALTPARSDAAQLVSTDGTAQEGLMLSAQVAGAAPMSASLKLAPQRVGNSF